MGEACLLEGNHHLQQLCKQSLPGLLPERDSQRPGRWSVGPWLNFQPAF